MIHTRRITILIALLFLAGAGDICAQHVPSRERVDPSLRRRTEIDGNNVRASVFNFVFSGRTSGSEQAHVPYEWPKNTKRYYVALVALFVGAEVVDNSGQTVQLVEVPAYRFSPTGGDWNLNPIPGYFNVETGKIAKSDEPATWPSSWPDKLTDPLDPGWRGKWNGFFGKDQFNADQEMFYRVGDDNYDRYDYTPDTTDRTRRGLGAIVDVRVLEWSQASVADAVFFIQEVKNDGTKDLTKAAVTLWLADFVGGDGDSQDDRPNYDLLLDIAYSADRDCISSNPAFQGVFVGAAGTLYLETPGNAEDRIDNDGDSPEFALGPKVTYQMLLGAGPFPAEVTGNQLDENHNGLIDEDSTYIPFGPQRGVGFADGIDNNDDGESTSPVISQQMINEATADPWNRWPPNPETDPFWAPNSPFNQESIHLIQLGSEDLGKKFKDNIDNDGNWYPKPSCLNVLDLPVVTQPMIDTAALDPYRRYRVPGTKVVLYDLGPEDLGKRYINRDRLRETGVDEGIDEMNDEGRNDGVDDDGDWNPFTDDVGLDGAASTGDCGEGDGIPTSGVGTAFPGEPNTDKVDVAEADQIGLTNVQYETAGSINFSATRDVVLWARFMIPGSFIPPAFIPTGEGDLFASSGVFPLRTGQIERISYAVVLGNALRSCLGDPDYGGARIDILRKRDFAQLAYNEDYQFTQAPLEPTLTAIPSDRRVTLYWDDRAERSEDRFLKGVGYPNPKDFEGYRIYRATDPAFEDARLITDAQGNPAPWLLPIAQFDLVDGVKGLDSVGFNGVKFDMGNDSGLRHSFVDTTVQNGQKYYYVVRAYDKGVYNYPLPTPPGQPQKFLSVAPAESNLRINIDNLTGKVASIGSSVAIVVPEAPAAGFVPTEIKIQHVSGSSTGIIDYTVLDPFKIKDNYRYRITFEDTLHLGVGTNVPDTIKTKSFTLADITNPTSIDTLIDRSRAFADTVEQPITDGFRLALRNEKFFGLNRSLSRWNNPGIWPFDFKQWKSGFYLGVQKPNDYRIAFGPLGVDTSVQYRVAAGASGLVASKPVNFKVFNTTEMDASGNPKQIDFAFAELDTTGGPGIFSARRVGFVTFTDKIIFLERSARGDTIITWSFSAYDSLLRRPTDGDTATIILSKLFRGPQIDTAGVLVDSGDVFEFTTRAQRIDRELAKSSLDRIKVVPNPYVAAASWEERNPFASGRGPRSIHFNHVPSRCTIRIYTVSGELVATIEHDEPGLIDGSAEWNLLTRDNLAASYGVYIYHVDAPGIGDKVGKFAIIK